MFNKADAQKIRPLRFIRKNFEWRSYLEDHYTIKYAGEAELRVCCPYCGESKHKCYVNVDKTVFHCFKCVFTTRKGAFDVFDFVSLTEGITKGQAIMRLLREYKPVTPEDFAAALEGSLDTVPEQEKKFRHESIKMPVEAVRLEHNTAEAEPFWEYLVTERGLTEHEVTQVMQTYYVPEQSVIIKDVRGNKKGDIGRRILWPLYGDNRLMSWQGRCFESDDDVKYFNAPDTDITGTVWPFVPPRPGTFVILCEGILDCVALRRLPKDKFTAYATFSKHINSTQIELLKSWGVEHVILFWDQDAKKEVKSAVKELQLHFTTFVPRFNSHWIKENLDCGDCLKLPDGVALINAAVENPIKVNSLDYVKWELS